jgi:predicted PurR-regulated permease PerM
MVGPVVSAVPAVLVAATQSPAQAIATLVLYVVIQQVENNFLVPKIMERAVRLHPLAVVLALLIGGQVLGIAGALLAVPVAAALAVVLDELRPLPAPVPTAVSAVPESQRAASSTPSDGPVPEGSPRP